MRLYKKTLLIIPVLTVLLTGYGQPPSDDGLSEILRAKDSVLFHAAFNACDPDTMASLFTKDFEFYHDRSGVTTGRDTFLTPMYERCQDQEEEWVQPSKRILIANSLRVYPLKTNGELYGAIQEGMHRFEFLNENKLYQKGDIARFIHLWVLEEGQWKIKRELSYDHQPPGSYQLYESSNH
jgi:hypothetical protein